MIARRRLLWLVLLAGLGPGAAAPAADAGVAIVLSDDSAVYREMAAAIEQAAVAAGVAAGIFRTWPAGEVVAAGRESRLMVAVGTRALDAVLAADSTLPVVAVLIPRESFERRAELVDARSLSAVFVDQPLARQFDLLELALPGRVRVGVVLGPSSQGQLAALQSVATPRGLRLVIASVGNERELFPAIERVIGEADVLLALPDPLVFNAGTIQNILLAAYRRQVPMVGFSPAYLRAGALLTLQSSPSQVAVSAVEAIRAGLARRPLPPPRYPLAFSLSVNRHVARSLGLTIDEEAELTRRLQAQEGTR